MKANPSAPACSVDQVLAHPAAGTAFRAACKRSFCYESVAFLSAVQKYRTLGASMPVPTWAAANARKDIIQRFIAVGAPEEVNLGSDVRDALLAASAARDVLGGGDDDKKIFNIARGDIAEMLTKDQLPAFYSSPHYRSLPLVMAAVEAQRKAAEGGGKDEGEGEPEGEGEGEGEDEGEGEAAEAAATASGAVVAQHQPTTTTTATGPIKRGWMRKKGQHAMAGKRLRYFVLSPGSLQYFKEEPQGSSSPAGTIRLADVTDVAPRKERGLTIATATGRTYVLKCDGDTAVRDRDEWVAAIRRALTPEFELVA